MKLLLINTVCGIRSTGRICGEIAKKYEAKGWDVRIGYGRVPGVPEWCRKWAVRIGSSFSVYLHALIVRFWGDYGLGRFKSYYATKRFLRWAESWHPDMVWMHSINGYYLNVELLFEWLKRHPDIKVKWTLHDCWAFTGRCGHFILSGCRQWEHNCVRCPDSYRSRNQLFSRNCYNDFMRKKLAFCGVKDLTLVTPCKWLAELTRKSFLREYPVEVLYNTIDTGIFKPVKSDIHNRLCREGQRLIIGVSGIWNTNKGLEDFYQLRKLIPENKYVIVLVGLNVKQSMVVPAGIIGLKTMNNLYELAKIYSAADWFFNPTHEDNFPTVNLEARACGCKIVTYDTGGCSETVDGYDKAWVLSGDSKNPQSFVRILKQFYTKDGHN